MSDTSRPVPRLCSVQPSAEAYYHHVARGIMESLRAVQPASTKVQANPRALKTHPKATLRHGLVPVGHFLGMKKRRALRGLAPTLGNLPRRVSSSSSSSGQLAAQHTPSPLMAPLGR
jgi:hypothetical protein